MCTNLKTNIILVSKNLAEARFRCMDCQKAFISKTHLEKHALRRHDHHTTQPTANGTTGLMELSKVFGTDGQKFIELTNRLENILPILEVKTKKSYVNAVETTEEINENTNCVNNSCLPPVCVSGIKKSVSLFTLPTECPLPNLRSTIPYISEVENLEETQKYLAMEDIVEEDDEHDRIDSSNHNYTVFQEISKEDADYNKTTEEMMLSTLQNSVCAMGDEVKSVDHVNQEYESNCWPSSNLSYNSYNSTTKLEGIFYNSRSTINSFCENTQGQNLVKVDCFSIEDSPDNSELIQKKSVHFSEVIEYHSDTMSDVSQNEFINNCQSENYSSTDNLEVEKMEENVVLESDHHDNNCDQVATDGIGSSESFVKTVHQSATTKPIEGCTTIEVMPIGDRVASTAFESGEENVNSAYIQNIKGQQINLNECDYGQCQSESVDGKSDPTDLMTCIETGLPSGVRDSAEFTKTREVILTILEKCVNNHPSGSNDISTTCNPRTMFEGEISALQQANSKCLVKKSYRRHDTFPPLSEGLIPPYGILYTGEREIDQLSGDSYMQFIRRRNDMAHHKSVLVNYIYNNEKSITDDSSQIETIAAELSNHAHHRIPQQTPINDQDQNEITPEQPTLAKLTKGDYAVLLHDETSQIQGLIDTLTTDLHRWKAAKKNTISDTIRFQLKERLSSNLKLLGIPVETKRISDSTFATVNLLLANRHSKCIKEVPLYFNATKAMFLKEVDRIAKSRTDYPFYATK